MTLDEAARTLRERAERARIARECRATELREGLARLLRARAPAGSRFWLVGSLAWGGFGARSDIDLVGAELSGPDAARLEYEIASTLCVDVDLLHVEDLPQSFQRRVAREGIPLDVG